MSIRKIYLACFFILAAFAFLSCKKGDEVKLPYISLRTGNGYTANNVTLPAMSEFKIGINASKSENVDVLTKFDITKTVGSQTGINVYNTSLTGADGDSYSYDYTGTVDDIAGQIVKYTFTVTSRDGLTNQVSLNITTQP